ncbi:MAG: zf-HC2 domain-containing protein, partial [Candidatus Omnitrophica bacterium]|nr:zf-HC2 domain-containing protein [Candidatus Omnitrophota bacterium]
MDCRFKKVWLSYYLDGMLPLKEREKIEAHLKTCSLCAEELERLNRIAYTLKHLRSVEVSPDYDQKFQRRLEEREEKRKSPVLVLREGLSRGLEDLIRIFTPQPALVKIGLGIMLVLGLVYFGREIGNKGLPE